MVENNNISLDICVEYATHQMLKEKGANLADPLGCGPCQGVYKAEVCPHYLNLSQPLQPKQELYQVKQYKV